MVPSRPTFDPEPTSRRQRAIAECALRPSNPVPGRSPGAASLATSSANDWAPFLPVTLPAKSGSTTRRVSTSWRGVFSRSMPSRKNGRFSSKNMGNRWLAVTTSSSASTWAKSGFTVASRTRLDDTLARAVRLGCQETGSATNRRPASSRRPSCDDTTVGISSTERSGAMWVRPRRTPAWSSRLVRPRTSGRQESSSSLRCLIDRCTCRPQVRPSPTA